MARIVNTSPFVKIPDGLDAVHERITPANEALVAQMHGRYYELCRQGNLFWAGNMAGAAHAYSAALSATNTGVCISNPAGNNKDLVIEGFGFSNALAYVALSFVGIQGGYSVAGVVTHTTPAVYGTDFGCLALGSSATPTALVDEHCTTVNPRLLMVFGASALATAVPGGAGFWVDVGGGIRVQPGGWVSTYCFTAITGNSTFWWSEEPR